MEKRTYQRPTVEKIGTVASHTLQNSLQNAIDQNFPAGQPVSGLTGS
jgi:hypothetical protein